MYKLEVITNQNVSGEQVKFDIDFKDLEDFEKQMKHQATIKDYKFKDKYGIVHEFNSSIIFRMKHYEIPDFDFFNLEKKDNGGK